MLVPVGVSLGLGREVLAGSGHVPPQAVLFLVTQSRASGVGTRLALAEAEASPLKNVHNPQ